MRNGDPLRETIGQPRPIILPEPALLFARRAARLTHLAKDHPMAAWLQFMAGLARAQHVAAQNVSSVAVSGVVEGVAPLDVTAHRRDPMWCHMLDTVLQAAAEPAQPDVARAALARVRARSPEAQEALADDYLRGEVAPEATAEAVYVAASLAVYFATRAAALPLHELHLLPQRGRCPVCASAPVVGVITAAGQAPGARYLHCGLCATAWNHVRAICITCGEARGLALLSVEGGDGVMQAETCSECHSYAKMLYQAQDMQVEPMADDLASLGLDLLVAEAGFARHAPNPLIINPRSSSRKRG